MKLDRLWGIAPFKPSYDVVVIGGGIHGLATAFFLAKAHNCNNVAVIERRHVGYGGSSRNTAIVRANQRTQQNVKFYNEGLALWPTLIDELDFNMMHHNCGMLDLIHSEYELAACRMHASIAAFCGVDSEILDFQQCRELIPDLNPSREIEHPIQGGMYHPPGGILRHDGVTLGLAKGAAAHGVHIHQQTEVTGIQVESGKVVGVATNRGNIKTPKVLIAAGGYSNLLAHGLGIRLPIHTLTIQAAVTQPLKPFLNHIVASAEYWVYANQTLKGEVACGAHLEAWPNYTNNTTPQYLEHLARGLVEIMPSFRGIKFMRHWAGLADMTYDSAPIMEGNHPLDGLFLDVGWGYFGFKAGPIAGKYMARYMAEDARPAAIDMFSLKRFENFMPNGEGAGAYSYGPWN